MDYRREIYQNYFTNTLKNTRGDADLKTIETHFSAWDVYCGRHIPQEKDIDILEIGCGNGALIHYLSRRGYLNVTGIDISNEQVGQARKLGISGVFVADANEYLKDKMAMFDVILARDVIEHFRKDEIVYFLKQAYSALRVGGRMIIQTTNAESPLSGRRRYWDLTHEISFTSNSLNQVLKTAGFQKISIYPVRPICHGIKSGVRLSLWVIIEKVLQLFLAIETGTPKGIFTQNIIAVGIK